MILTSFGRSKMVRGVSLLGLCALVGVRYSGLRPEIEPESMRLKTEFELEGLADPIFEELFQDKYHRALEEYQASRTLFSCDDVCQALKRRLQAADVELTITLRQRLAARKAILIRAREDRLETQQANQAANAERRTFSHIAPEERISVRRLARKAERDAAHAEARAALRASLGIGPPLTLAEKQANAAAKLAARIAARESRKTPAESKAEAEERQDARWFDYLDSVAQAHGFDDWVHVELIMNLTPAERADLRDEHSDSMLVSRANVRKAARGAVARSEPPIVTTTPTTPFSASTASTAYSSSYPSTPSA